MHRLDEKFISKNKVGLEPGSISLINIAKIKDLLEDI